MRGECGRALKLPYVREGCVMKEPMITGRQPDSGNPTVRDERGACENVNYGEGYTGTYSGNAETAKPLAYGCARRISTRRIVQNYSPDEREVESCRRHAGTDSRFATAVKVYFREVFPSLRAS